MGYLKLSSTERLSSRGGGVLKKYRNRVDELERWLQISQRQTHGTRAKGIKRVRLKRELEQCSHSYNRFVERERGKPYETSTEPFFQPGSEYSDILEVCTQKLSRIEDFAGPPCSSASRVGDVRPRSGGPKAAGSTINPYALTPMLGPSVQSTTFSGTEALSLHMIITVSYV
jgi:hypothetical protein